MRIFGILLWKKSCGISIMPYGIRHMGRSYLKLLPFLDEDCIIEMCLYYKTDNDNPLIAQFVQLAINTHLFNIEGK